MIIGHLFELIYPFDIIPITLNKGKYIGQKS